MSQRKTACFEILLLQQKHLGLSDLRLNSRARSLWFLSVRVYKHVTLLAFTRWLVALSPTSTPSSPFFFLARMAEIASGSRSATSLSLTLKNPWLFLILLTSQPRAQVCADALATVSHVTGGLHIVTPPCVRRVLVNQLWVTQPPPPLRAFCSFESLLIDDQDLPYARRTYDIQTSMRTHKLAMEMIGATISSQRDCTFGEGMCPLENTNKTFQCFPQGNVFNGF